MTPIEMLLNNVNASSTGVANNLDNLFMQETLNRFGNTGVYRTNPNPEYYGGVDPILSAIGGVSGTRSLLDMALKRYGKKAFTKIRGLIDYDRAIAMDIPEKSHYLQRGINRMLKTVEPDAKKRNIIKELIDKEDMEEFTIPFAESVLRQLKTK